MDLKTVLGIAALATALCVTPAKAIGPVEKLQDGALDAVKFLAEMPMTVVNESKNHNIIYGLTIGQGEGYVNALMRGLNGIWQVSTAPLPNLPNGSYDSYLKDRGIGEPLGPVK